jgi:hypothetical protein
LPQHKYAFCHVEKEPKDSARQLYVSRRLEGEFDENTFAFPARGREIFLARRRGKVLIVDSGLVC